MANFQTHLYGGILVGVGGALCGMYLNLFTAMTAPIVALAGIFGGIAPDLDHDHGRPIRILFSISAVLLPPLFIFRFAPQSSWLDILKLWSLLGLFIRYPVCWLFKKLTVHRGIFHSVPAIGIFGAILYLLTDHDVHNPKIQGTIAICGGTGYFIHLLLDELWSVDFNGVATRIKRSSGTALAFTKKDPIITSVAYIVLAILVILCWSDYNNFPLTSL